MTTEISVVWLGALASLCAGLATGVGALAIFLVRTVSHKLQDGMLASAAGVMLAASFFSLLLPGLEYGEEITGQTWSAALIVIFGFLSGAAALLFVHQKLPHKHFELGREGPDASYVRGIWLFIFAITLHNFPEGMAVGVGFAGGDLSNGYALATGIGLQNMPEGLAVAIALMGEGYSRWRAFGIATLTGLIEPLGGLFGAGVVTLSQMLLPWGLAFAAGAMLYVISHEIIPETHRSGHQNKATLGLALGLVIMLFLDVWLG
jgi:ZIP family zinc transporter